jgi:hypothetical protein
MISYSQVFLADTVEIVLVYPTRNPTRVVRAHPTTQSWDPLVMWQNNSSTDTSWEQLEAFKKAYLDFQLEDKLFEPEGGGVMLWILILTSSIVKEGRHRVGPTAANVGHWQDYLP